MKPLIYLVLFTLLSSTPFMTVNASTVTTTKTTVTTTNTSCPAKHYKHHKKYRQSCYRDRYPVYYYGDYYYSPGYYYEDDYTDYRQPDSRFACVASNDPASCSREEVIYVPDNCSTCGSGYSY